ncbi:hypothetical protein BDN71DRAFT_1396256 [Pleurotus eryngii]|uniref:Uncharacterized protein n=1 Tax=Pleurotus eryngii TaxID=5323 RepID=A0A9P5ZRN7_PLEER|nr:hypothetical protein BDN71DRAFT_1396256 [Pleurotus eryngii]
MGTMVIIGLDAKMPGKDCGDLNTCNKGTIRTGSMFSFSSAVEFVVPAIDAITAQVGSSATITPSLPNDLDNGVAAAHGKDLAFVFITSDSGELGFYTVVEGNMAYVVTHTCLSTFSSGSQVERIAAICDNMIVVLLCTFHTLLYTTSRLRSCSTKLIIVY